jgi:glycosyltransferase involved in cell wall biosynthesis
MRKIYINGRFLTQPTTGVQRYGQEIISGLDQLIATGEIDPTQYQISILTPPQPTQPPALQHLSIRAVGRWGGHRWEQLELPDYCRDGLLFCPGNLAPLRSLGRTHRTIVTLHDLSFSYFSQAYRFRFSWSYQLLVGRIIRHATRLITVSAHERQRIIELFPQVADKLESVPSGVRWYSQEKRPAKRAGEESYILFVGSINRIKNLENLLAALAIVQTRYPIPLKVVGGRSDRVFRPVHLSHALSQVSQVEFLGQINDPAQLHACYTNATFLAMPSFSESFGFPCLEAMTTGCPVLASDIGGLREVCGPAALYCNPHDPQDIAAKIIQLWTQPDQRADLVARGYQQATPFTWERTARATWRILSTAAKN